MKRKILLFALVLGLFTFNSCSEEEVDLNENQMGVQEEMTARAGWPKIKEGGFKTVWTIGRKSRNCRGIGICKHEKTSAYIKIGDETITVPLFRIYENNDIQAFISPSPDESRFSLLTNDSNLANIRKSFGKNAIILEEDYEFTEKESSDLNIQSGFLIKAGEYPFGFDEVNGLHEIIFENSK